MGCWGVKLISPRPDSSLAPARDFPRSSCLDTGRFRVRICRPQPTQIYCRKLQKVYCVVCTPKHVLLPIVRLPGIIHGKLVLSHLLQNIFARHLTIHHLLLKTLLTADCLSYGNITPSFSCLPPKNKCFWWLESLSLYMTTTGGIASLLDAEQPVPKTLRRHAERPMIDNTLTHGRTTA